MNPDDDILELPRTVRVSYAVFGNLEAAETLRAQGKIGKFYRAIGKHDQEGRNYLLVKKDGPGEAERAEDELRPFLSPGAKIVVGRLYYE